MHEKMNLREIADQVLEMERQLLGLREYL